MSFSKGPGAPPDYPPSYLNAPPPQPVELHRTMFASMSMHMTDRLRFLQFSIDDINAVRTVITQYWSSGLQDEQNYHGSYEFKLRGNPWRGQYSEAIYARRLMCRILEALANRGWVMTLTTDISKKDTDKDTLLFRYQQPEPAQCEWMCIAFSKWDRIRFIDSPRDIVEGIIQKLGKEVKSHSPHDLPNAYELKLHGSPWRATGGESMVARSILLHMMEGLDSQGWTVYASVDQKAGAGGDSQSSETDTWHCCRRLGWVPGLPVYHN